MAPNTLFYMIALDQSSFKARIQSINPDCNTRKSDYKYVLVLFKLHNLTRCEGSILLDCTYLGCKFSRHYIIITAGSKAIPITSGKIENFLSRLR
jgi:hypothetical protein